MSIKIRDIPDDGLELRLPLGRPLLKDALASLDGDLDRSHAEMSGMLHRSGDNVFMHGALSGEVMVPCVRCLGEVATRVSAPLDMAFLPVGAVADEKQADDVAFATHDGKQIELDDLMREALILAVPMNPLCRADCKGLCPKCGAELNQSECGCDKRVIDPRLAVLKEIKL